MSKEFEKLYLVSEADLSKITEEPFINYSDIYNKLAPEVIKKLKFEKWIKFKFNGSNINS